MPAYMYIHPFFGALVVALILGAFAMKIGRRKFRKLHYVTGLAAFAAALTAAGIAAWATWYKFYDEIGDPLEELSPTIWTTLLPHTILAILVLLTLLAQVGMGATMRVFKRATGRVFPFHRRNARLLVRLVVLASLLGLATVGLILVKA